MLRGINVAGKKIVRMEDLRASFEALGFGRVRTYIQSGNVIFEASKVASDNLSETIAKKISKDFGFSIPVVLRTSDELKKIIRDNPFLNEKHMDHSKFHVTFLSALPARDAEEKIDALNAHPDQFGVSGREIYLYCPNGYGRSKVSNLALEKALSVGATTRNWNTLNTLARISSE
ncbi:MAG: hypothetical protein AUI50_00290 [Crenarchaeota archaeon 13_1_40CM_2_52_14]|nr:MAG: hypothetical protein AUI97_02740 [Crenarchaeota archaeon 13_1_40CM_3_52_17]OLD35877.1 MAG: hypothetical protein AUI50_00290 [Crenarchaeota archaeon 13_1_40CM_2_52_14]OLE69965.1 MAG: hypothetical protein AUF78_08725 [archaeon 13_1_20CM_2_51_12]